MSGLIIGKIVKAQGIKGEVKVVPITDDVLRFNALKSAFIDENRLLNVQSVRIDGDVVYVKFAEIETRNDAELLAGKFVSVNRDSAAPLQENRYYIVDLLGCVVKSKKKNFGTLIDVLQHGAADVYVLSSNGKTVMFPAVKDVLIKVDIVSKTIEVDEKRFEEIAVYD